MHAKGGLLYMDGANMNAFGGQGRGRGILASTSCTLICTRRFSTPHGGGGRDPGRWQSRKYLSRFFPTPVVITKPDGTMALNITVHSLWDACVAFYGNFGMFIRALAYIFANGPDGLRQTRKMPCSNANYIRKGLEGTYDLPYSTPSMHEVVFSDKVQSKKGVKTMDLAKRLIDYGFHPYTTAFSVDRPGRAHDRAHRK